MYKWVRIDNAIQPETLSTTSLTNIARKAALNMEIKNHKRRTRNDCFVLELLLGQLFADAVRLGLGSVAQLGLSTVQIANSQQKTKARLNKFRGLKT